MKRRLLIILGFCVVAICVFLIVWKRSTMPPTLEDLRTNSPAIWYNEEDGGTPIVDPKIIYADYHKIRKGMTLDHVYSILGKSQWAIRQKKPTRIIGHGLAEDTALYYQVSESYYPSPPLKRRIDSPYMMEGFIIFYDPTDEVVHKQLNPLVSVPEDA